MKKHFTLALLCLFVFYSFSQQAGDLIITEIMNNPKAVSDANGEWFEVYNTTNDTINIKGWQIEDLGSDSHIVDSNVLISPKSHFIFGRKADTLINGGVKVDYAFTFTLTNTDDEIIFLLPTNGLIIDKVLYDKSNGFPAPNGASFVLNLDYENSSDTYTTNDSAVNWIEESTNTYGDGDYGTPHYRNSTILFSFETNTKESNEFIISPTIITNQQFTVNHVKNTELLYNIYSIEGNLAQSGTLTTNSATMLNLLPGVYLVKVNDQTAKIIVE